MSGCQVMLLIALEYRSHYWHQTITPPQQLSFNTFCLFADKRKKENHGALWRRTTNHFCYSHFPPIDHHSSCLIGVQWCTTWDVLSLQISLLTKAFKVALNWTRLICSIDALYLSLSIDACFHIIVKALTMYSNVINGMKWRRPLVVLWRTQI